LNYIVLRWKVWKSWKRIGWEFYFRAGFSKTRVLSVCCYFRFFD